MSDIIGFLIFPAFIGFILYITNKELGWWKYFEGLLVAIKNQIIRWSR